MVENGHLISDKDIEFIKEKMLNLQGQPLDRYQKNIKAISYLNYLFEKIGLQPIIVGGHAVELYTAGHYTTVDVDLVVPGFHDYAKEILKNLGFTKRLGERHWYNKELILPIEVPDNVLCGAMEKVVEVTIEKDYCVYVIGIEDLILDRVKAAVYWDSTSDREWALFLMSAQWDEIDFEYLKNEARQETIKENNPGVHKMVLNLIIEAEMLMADE